MLKSVGINKCFWLTGVSCLYTKVNPNLILEMWVGVVVQWLIQLTLSCLKCQGYTLDLFSLVTVSHNLKIGFWCKSNNRDIAKFLIAVMNMVTVVLVLYQFTEIEQKTGQASYSYKVPDFIFEVEYSDFSTHNAKFNELSQIHSVWYAYHGSRVDNFHSILHNGLHAHLNKV